MIFNTKKNLKDISDDDLFNNNLKMEIINFLIFKMKYFIIKIHPFYIIQNYTDLRQI